MWSKNKSFILIFIVSHYILQVIKCSNNINEGSPAAVNLRRLSPKNNWREKCLQNGSKSVPTVSATSTSFLIKRQLKEKHLLQQKWGQLSNATNGGKKEKK